MYVDPLFSFQNQDSFFLLHLFMYLFSLLLNLTGFKDLVFGVQQRHDWWSWQFCLFFLDR